MKKIISLLIIFIISYPSSLLSFSDIENSWYKESILELKEEGIISGFDDGSFGADKNITRAEILKVIFNSAQITISIQDNDSCFSDLKNDFWYVSYICFAHEKNIAKGYEDGTYRPNGDVSILEVIALTLRTFEIETPEAKQGENWYNPVIQFTDDNNIIEKNAYTINSPARRGQAVDIISRIKKLHQGESLNYKSAGCFNSQSLADTNTITINNKERSYILSFPNNYKTTTPYPLVIGLHGRTNSNEMVRDYMGISGGKWKKAPEEVISVYPAGLGNGPYTWHESENIDFIDAMLNEVSDNLCINRSKIHVVGHSLGAYFSNKLACLRGDIISTMTGVAGPGYSSQCRGPVATLILHNKSDSLVPFISGERATTIRKEKNLCNGEEKNINISGFNCSIWEQCSEGNPVAFCTEYPTYGSVPHSWPTGGARGIYEFIDLVEEN